MRVIKELSDGDSESSTTDSEGHSRYIFNDVGTDDTKPILKVGYKRSVSASGLCAMRKRRRVTRFNYYLKDLFTSLVDSRWRWILFISTSTFIITWFLFALLWWVVAYAHGDLPMSPFQRDPDKEPCVSNIIDLTTAFLFSLETQYTTGYGQRYPTDQCPEAIFILCIQSIFGMILQSVLVGIVFVKLSRPKARTQTILFSENAVICQRDGNLCLMFRLADVRKSHLIGCKVYAWMLQHRRSQEGEILPNYQRKLKVSVDDGGPDLFLLWPVTVVHKINSRSPLYDLSAVHLFSAEFEIVVSLVCTTETTGQTTEARRSYTPSEILWGHRFHTIVHREETSLQVDYAQFDKTTSVNTPLCSAHQLMTWSHSQPTSPNTPPSMFKFPYHHSQEDYNKPNEETAVSF